jgi:hypothetical protein
MKKLLCLLLLVLFVGGVVGCKNGVDKPADNTTGAK